jgi:hypothetical protein
MRLGEQRGGTCVMLFLLAGRGSGSSGKSTVSGKFNVIAFRARVEAILGARFDPSSAGLARSPS